jgi:hypothetical protein
MMHIFVGLIFLIVAIGIVAWLLSKVPIPAPFSYILYAVIALVALFVLYWLFTSLPWNGSLHSP